MNYSVTIAGIIASLIGTIAKQLNYELPFTGEEISNAILVILSVGGLVVAYIGRVRKGDIDWLGRKRS